MLLFYTNSILLQRSCIGTFWTQITTCKLFLFHFYLKAKFAFVKKIPNSCIFAGKCTLFLLPRSLKSIKHVGRQFLSSRQYKWTTSMVVSAITIHWYCKFNRTSCECMTWLCPVGRVLHSHAIFRMWQRVWIPLPLSQIGTLWLQEVGA